jgi:alkylation response protein AidB-like acyl-CoA dehydrogenase
MGTLPDPLQAAQALRTTIRATRQETEASRRLAPQVVEGLLEAGLCRLDVPVSLGGHEAEPVVALQVFEELAWADASVAWIAWNNHFVCLASRYSSDAVRTALFRDARGLFANATRPSGRAVVVDGGLRVSGRWTPVSGCELADWILVMCVVTEGTAPRLLADGTPAMRMAYLPKGAYRILDTWDVGGLRGTGSHDIVVDDVFVPAERTFAFTDPQQRDRPLARMPMAPTMCAGIAALCLGLAQAATDTLLELGASKVQVGPFPGLRERPDVQGMVASTAAQLEAARLLLHGALGDLWAICLRGTPVTDAQRARVFASGLHAAQTAKAVVTAMYEAAGTSALYSDCPIERAHRDISAVMQHVQLAPIWLEAAGRVRLGLPPQHPFFGV